MVNPAAKRALRTRLVTRSLRHNLALGVFLALPCGIANATPALTVLITFNGTDGAGPTSGLIADPAGGFYGATGFGGTLTECEGNGCGTVFELTPPPAGGQAWTETVLFAFDDTDGAVPTGLVAGADGNLYGAANDIAVGAPGFGTVFKLTPPSRRQTAWVETPLFTFNPAGGRTPIGGLVTDAAGALFGTTSDGGKSDHGTVFELKPLGKHQTSWKEKILTSFQNFKHGSDPLGTLIFDKAGDLYGTTAAGGTNGDGAVFELTPPAAGSNAWKLRVLTSFNGIDGEEPWGSLLADAAGNLYGTTNEGGTFGDGTVFKLEVPAPGHTAWTKKVLFSFNGTGGESPYAGLIADAAGNLYGTTYYGGASSACKGGCGTVFELSPPAYDRTAWTETVLASFDGTNGAGPHGSLIADAAGNLYGTTSTGGATTSCDCGTVFELTGTGFALMP